MGGTREWKAVSFWSRNQKKPWGDAEHSEVKRWSGAKVVVCVTADVCEVHTVCVPGSVLNSFQGSCTHNLPHSLGIEHTNGCLWGHFAFLEATELNRTEVQVHRLRQLGNSYLVYSRPPPPLRGDAGF